MKKMKYFLLSLSLVTFVTSLFLEAACHANGCSIGLVWFLWGSLGFLFHPLIFFVWLANPFMILSWVSSISPRSYVLCIISGLTSMIMLLSYLTFDETFTFEGAGSLTPMTSYGPGYWLWLTSGVLTLATSIVNAIFVRKQHTSSPKRGPENEEQYPHLNH